MFIVIAIFAITTIITSATCLWGNKEEGWVFNVLIGPAVGLLVALTIGNIAWAATYSFMQEDVEVRWNLAKPPSGEWVTNGVSGEYNKPTFVGYYRHNGSLRQFYRYASNSAVAETNESSAFVLLSCPSPTTLPAWVRGWWDDEHAEANCDNAFATFYVPKGE